MKWSTRSLEKSCAIKTLFLFLIFVSILIPPSAHAQESAEIFPPSDEVYQNALDPSQPADRPLQNPLKVFEIQETRKTVVRGPQKKSRSLSIKTEKPSQATAKEAAVPVPPRRPKTLNASQSFILKARENAQENGAEKKPVSRPAPKPVEKTAKISAPAPAAVRKPEIKQITPGPVKKDALEETLVQPSLLDILRSIDPKAAKEKPPAASNAISLAYKPGVTELPDNIKDILSAGLLSRLTAEPATRLLVTGYATAPDNNEAKARETAMARTRNIKGFMATKGIESSRIDIKSGRPSAYTAHQSDRVDLQLITP